jgi:hypothetical protein
MNRQEYFDFMRETANISIDIGDSRRLVAVDSDSLELLVNATIKLCMETALNVVHTVESDYVLEELQTSLQSLQVK